MELDVGQLWSLSFHAQQLQEMYSYEFMRAALAGSLLIALVGGYLAVHVVLRRVVFASVALAECSALGVALGLLRGVAHTALVPFSVGFGMLGVMLVSLLDTGRRITQEAVVGLIYGGAAAVSITLLAVAGKHEGHELQALLWGDVLALSASDIKVLAVAFAVVIVVHALTYKEFLLTGFDPEMAASIGYSVRLWNLLFFALLGLVIAFAVRNLGLLVVFSYLVMPGVAGLCLARRMRGVFLCSIAVAIVGSLLGVYASWLLDLPTGPANVVALTVLTALSGLKRLFSR